MSTDSKTTFVTEPGQLWMRMERVFDASRDRVFNAYVDPEAIPRWWGPRDLVTTIDKLEAKQGGIWRFVQRRGERTFAFHGVFHEVRRPETIVQTWEFEGAPGNVLLNAFTFEELNGGRSTRVSALSVCQTTEAAEALIKSGAERGAREGWERLAELLET